MKTEREIQDDVIRALRAEPSLEAEHIGVAVKDKAVSLSGWVKSTHDHIRAASIANQIPGVGAVHNHLNISPKERWQNKDPEILFEVLEVLKWHSAIEQETISASVSNGRVTLTGAVDWNYQRTNIGRLVSMLKGVEQLDNQIKVCHRSDKVS